MDATQAKQHPVLRGMVERLEKAVGGRLRSVLLYGPAAHGDQEKGRGDFNLMVVCDDLEPPTLEAVAPSIRSWVRGGQPPPRLMTPALIADSIDVFPIEVLDIRSHHVLLQGSDPFAGLRVRTEHLRLQCERELREKLMRLREGYIEAHGSPAHLRRLLTASYTTFAAVFGGCLHLVGTPPPARAVDVTAAFCARAGLDVEAFRAIDRLRRGEAGPALDLTTLFSGYYEALQKAVGTIDRFRPEDGGETR